MIAVLLLTGIEVPGSRALAQGDGLVNGDRYDLDIGSMLSWDRPWEPDLSLTDYDPASKSDLIVLQNEAATMVFLAERDEPTDPEAYRDRIVNTALNDWDAEILTTFDDDAGSQAAWIEGTGEDAFGAFYQAYVDDDGNLITTRLTAPVSEYADYWESLADSVDLDGESLFAGVDGEEAISIIVDGPAGEEATDEPPDASAREEAPADRPAESSGGRSAAPDEATGTPDEAAGTGDDQALRDAGLLGTGQYESPQFGFTLEWTADWELDPYYDQAVVSDTESGKDSCYLATVDGGEVQGYVSFEASTTRYESVDAYLDFLASADNLESAYGGRGVEVLQQVKRDDRGAYVLKVTGPDANADVFVLVEVTDLGDGAFVTGLFSAPEDLFLTVLERAQKEIVLDDEPVFSVIDIDDLASDLEG